jgi:hypothetical protein
MKKGHIIHLKVCLHITMILCRVTSRDNDITFSNWRRFMSRDVASHGATRKSLFVYIDLKGLFTRTIGMSCHTAQLGLILTLVAWCHTKWFKVKFFIRIYRPYVNFNTVIYNNNTKYTQLKGRIYPPSR